MTPRFAPLLVPLLMLACGPDTGFNRLLPDVALAPSALDFGPVRLGDDPALVLQVLNAGQGPLGVSGFTFTDPQASGIEAWTISPPALDVDAGSSAEVLVTFEPTALQAYQAELLIATDDPESPLLTVPLSGSGIEGGPDLVVDVDALDFGTVKVGGTSTRVFTIENAGDEDLVISASSQQSGAGAFSLQSDPRGEVLAPGDSFPVLVAYAPTGTDGDLGGFTLVSNDPEPAQVAVSFVGNGGGVTEYPVALIAATTESEPGDTVILDGTGSYDPGGNVPLTYAWTLLEQPPASVSAISHPTLSAPSLHLDTAGSYTVALQVTNTLGVPSAAAVHTIQGVPEQDVYVSLSWDTDDADLDLHLLQGDGVALFQTPTDCCWCNPSPDWGVAGDSGDDPLLEQEALADGGPESLLLADPADGAYYVRVHYFQDDGAGPTEATVRIYVHGELVEQYRRELTHNQAWDVAWLRWPEGYLIEENADPYASEHRSCQGG